MMAGWLIFPAGRDKTPGNIATKSGNTADISIHPVRVQKMP